MSAATLAAHAALKRNQIERERNEKELEEYKKSLTPEQLAKYEKEQEMSNGIVNLILLVLFSAVSAFVLWLFW